MTMSTQQASGSSCVPGAERVFCGAPRLPAKAALARAVTQLDELSAETALEFGDIADLARKQAAVRRWQGLR